MNSFMAYASLPFEPEIYTDARILSLTTVISALLRFKAAIDEELRRDRQPRVVCL